MIKPGGRFVWVRGQRGPVAEKWPHDMPVNSTAGKVVLDSHVLGADEFSLRISILEQRYRPPKDEPPEPDPAPTSPTPSPIAPAAAKRGGGMMTRTCPQCSTTFTATREGPRATCSERCRRERERGQYLAKKAREKADRVPAETKRWTAGEKARLVEAVTAGVTTEDAVCTEHEISVEEFDSWKRAFTASGVGGLRIKNLQQGRMAS